MGVFVTQWQNQVAVTETIQQAKCKIFTVWPSIESLYTPDLDYTLYWE